MFDKLPPDLEERVRQADEASFGTASRRPIIVVHKGVLPRIVAEAIGALAAETDPMARVYRHGTLLVRPLRMQDGLCRSGIHRPTGALALHLVQPDWLVVALADAARWEKPIKTENGFRVIAVDPPPQVVRSVLAAAPWSKLPALSGIVEAPAILPDGTTIGVPGFNQETGLLFDPGESVFPPIPASPTRQEAQAALQVLLRPFRDFPFVDEAARCVALALVLTVLVRRGLRAAPLFCFDAPKMASGKTLLATLAAYVATGREPYLMSQVADPTDERKRLLAALLEGPLLVVIDNVETTLKSDALCTALTEPVYTDRLLGFSRTATAPTNVTFAATGNNLVIAGDLTARSLICRLDPKCERPEEREFDLDLHSWVPEHRGELAAAALTIIKAYLVAGAPRPLVANFARFEQWQRLCRFPLIWLGLADPCASRSGIEDTDPVREALRPLLSAWHEAFGGEAKTVKDAIKAGSDHPGLKTAMETVAGDGKGGDINPRRLGKFIARHRGRIEAGLRFTQGGVSHQAVLWRAVPPDEDGS